MSEKELVNHPEHYTPGPYEVMKVLKVWGFITDAYIYQAICYLARSKKKGNEELDLKKAKFWIDARLEQIKEEREAEVLKAVRDLEGIRKASRLERIRKASRLVEDSGE